MGKLGLSEKWKSMKKWQKAVTVAVCVAVVLLAVSLFAGGDDGVRTGNIVLQAEKSYNDKRYVSYIGQYGEADYNGSVIEVDLLKDQAAGGAKKTSMETYEGRSALLTTDGDSVTWNLKVPKAGLYAIAMDYYTVEGYGSEIERNLYIDGGFPYAEAEGVEFTRVYVDENPNPSGQLNRPNQVEKNSWRFAYVTDSKGYYTPALYVYLTEGNHTLTLESVREPRAIGSLTLVSENVAPASYADTLAATRAQGAKEVTGVLENGIKIIEAENSLEKSDPTLYAKADTTSTKNSPYSYTQKLLNAVGGTSWQYSNQWITWEFEVPESGYYNMGVRAMQNFLQGLYFNRSLYIDGKLPFLEAENVHFYFGDEWQTFSLGEGEESEPWLFYLEKGTHTVTLKNTLGDVVPVLTEADSILESLSAVNLELLAILSTTPDVDRDYQIALYLPDTLKELEEDEARLQAICDAMIAATGERSSATSQLEMLISVVHKMYSQPNQIAGFYSRSFQRGGRGGEHHRLDRLRADRRA